MKKAMIAVVAFALAVAAYAGTVQWNSSTIYGVGSDGAFTSTEVSNGDVTGMLFVITEAAWTGYYDTYSANGYEQMAASIYGDYKAGTLISSATASSADGAITLTDGIKYSNGTYVYAALVYETKVGDQDYYIANLGDFKATTANKTVYDMAAYELGAGISGTESPITGWTAASVPEPTSALMLLVGLAGLALKRKVA